MVKTIDRLTLNDLQAKFNKFEYQVKHFDEEIDKLYLEHWSIFSASKNQYIDSRDSLEVLKHQRALQNQALSPISCDQLIGSLPFRAFPEKCIEVFKLSAEYRFASSVAAAAPHQQGLTPQQRQEAMEYYEKVKGQWQELSERPVGSWQTVFEKELEPAQILLDAVTSAEKQLIDSLLSNPELQRARLEAELKGQSYNSVLPSSVKADLDAFAKMRSRLQSHVNDKVYNLNNWLKTATAKQAEQKREAWLTETGHALALELESINEQIDALNSTYEKLLEQVAVIAAGHRKDFGEGITAQAQFVPSSQRLATLKVQAEKGNLHISGVKQ